MVLADSFAEEATKGILRTEQIEKFYDEVLFNLQKEKYLTRKQVDSIKKTELYRTQVDNTAKLMDEHMPGLEGKDKLYYQVARFTKAIGLPEISDHCLKQITPAKLEKIKIIETALSHGIKKFSLDIKNSIGKDNERLGKVIAKIPEKHETRSR